MGRGLDGFRYPLLDGCAVLRDLGLDISPARAYYRCGSPQISVALA
jgi:hypothetical protein